MTGPLPQLRGFPSAREESKAALDTIRGWLAKGVQPNDIALFARTKRALEAIEASLREAGLDAHRLVDREDPATNALRLGTMHRAKGLEFKAVIIAGCGEGQVPNAPVLGACTDPQDREDAEARERHLLYVAMTRARDELAVFWTGAPSPFLKPLLATRGASA